MTRPAHEVLIRKCQGLQEFDACVRLQNEVWGYDFTDTVPMREFVVIERIGGQIIGAFDLAKSSATHGDADAMVGFAMSMPAFNRSHHDQPYLHSHMLAVLPAYRNSGIGRRLKLAQRDDALTRGIETMEWTFDPLEVKNAYLNIVRLGIVVHSYTPSFYGVFSSRLQAGLPTDRLHAVWRMNSPRVQAALNGGTTPLLEIQETIVVPGAIREWKQSASEFPRAEAAQAEIRARFLDAFTRGLTVVGFSKAQTWDKLHGCESSSGESDGIYHLANWRES